MKLTPAEYKLLDEVQQNGGSILAHLDRKPEYIALIGGLLTRSLISKRAWNDGRVVATALGKRSHARGKS